MHFDSDETLDARRVTAIFYLNQAGLRSRPPPNVAVVLSSIKWPPHLPCFPCNRPLPPTRPQGQAQRTSEQWTLELLLAAQVLPAAVARSSPRSLPCRTGSLHTAASCACIPGLCGRPWTSLRWLGAWCCSRPRACCTGVRWRRFRKAWRPAARWGGSRALLRGARRNLLPP